MIEQAKQLKAAIKQVEITDHTGKTPSVRTRINRRRQNGLQYSEYDYAYAVIRTEAITEAQIKELKAISPYAKIFQVEAFTVIRSS